MYVSIIRCLYVYFLLQPSKCWAFRRELPHRACFVVFQSEKNAKNLESRGLDNFHSWEKVLSLLNNITIFLVSRSSCELTKIDCFNPLSPKDELWLA